MVAGVSMGGQTAMNFVNLFPSIALCVGMFYPRLHMDEILIALSISAVSDANAARAVEALSLLFSCEAHSTVILSHVDENVFAKLGMNLTCEPKYQTKKLFHR